MHTLLSGLKVAISPKIFLKDPETSDLGKKIIEHSILLIDEMGFENFTFKKLGEKIGSNESSIYRYFENKHKLLIYLTSWYWGWIEIKLVFTTNSIADPEEKLQKMLAILTEDAVEDLQHPHINEEVLSRIVICEFSKSYLTKEVDDENKEGYFMIYKRVINRLIEAIIAINPNYLYPKSLASMVIDGALHQHFLKNHFKSITDCSENKAPTDFFTNLVFKQLR